MRKSKVSGPYWKKCHTFPSVFCNHRVYNRTLWALKSLTSLVTHCYQFKMWTSPRFLVLFNGKTGKMPLRGRLHDSLFFSTAKQEKCPYVDVSTIPCSFQRQNRKNALNSLFFSRQNRKNASKSLFFSTAKQEKCPYVDVSTIPCSFQRQNRKNASNSLFFSRQNRKNAS